MGRVNTKLEHKIVAELSVNSVGVQGGSNIGYSTRAYRSRLDKWGVHKYSCRKRNGSASTNEDGSPDEDAPVLSPPRTPGKQHTSPLTDPEYPRTPGPMSPISPISSQGHRYFDDEAMCGTASPAGLGSPQYQQHQFAAVQHRHSISLPTPGSYMPDSQYNRFYHQQQQQHPDFYPQSPQSNGYYHQIPFQGQGSINTVSLPSSPNNRRFTQHGWVEVDEIKSPTE
ncbi:hypothetical protein B0T16DRAFT_418643 [Cercophora newfieldiana]|uniref:Clr5 domain-containing protein n=1 Tax=Cercophora newfieldiana TaxID=92897 RepID=A0AA39XVA5_9PEZI|nr:hypothetical protein B0T16DRAFT_418643 [Cercophora newfieldiana]